MTTVTLLEAATQYVASLDGDARATAQVEVNRFVRWYGANRLTGELRGHDVSLYGEELGAATAEAKRRADQVRAFLAFLKKKGMTPTSLAPHLRLKKGGRLVAAGAKEQREVELTAEGHEALKAELEALATTEGARAAAAIPLLAHDRVQGLGLLLGFVPLVAKIMPQVPLRLRKERIPATVGFLVPSVVVSYRVLICSHSRLFISNAGIRFPANRQCTLGNEAVG